MFENEIAEREGDQRPNDERADHGGEGEETRHDDSHGDNARGGGGGGSEGEVEHIKPDTLTILHHRMVGSGEF